MDITRLICLQLISMLRKERACIAEILAERGVSGTDVHKLKALAAWIDSVVLLIEASACGRITP